MKKRLFLIFALVWVVIALAVLALLVAGLSGKQFFGGFDMFMADSAKLVKEESFSLDEMQAFSISVPHHSLYVTLVDDTQITIRQYDADAENLFTAQAGDGRLAVSISPRSLSTMFGIWLHINPRLEISLPRSYANDIDFQASSGSIHLAGAPIWGITHISSRSGSIHIKEAMSCKTLELSAASGSIELYAARAESLMIHTRSGSQRLGDMEVTGELTCSAASGSIRTGNLRAARLFVKTSSGSIRTDGLSGMGSVESTSGSVHCGALDVQGDMSISSSSGSLRLTLAGDQHFRLQAGSSSGSIRADGISLGYDQRGKNASGTVGDGSRGMLTLRTASGSISVN